MNSKAVLSALALASVLGFSAPAMAQEHMINGNAVPADQVEAVQAKCDALRKAAADAGANTQSPAAGAETSTPAAGAATTTPDAGATTPAAGAEAPAPASDAASSSANGQIDLNTLTIEMCDKGGFSASAK